MPDDTAALSAVQQACTHFQATTISYPAWVSRKYAGEPGATYTAPRSSTEWAKGFASLDAAEAALAPAPPPPPPPPPDPPVIVPPTGTATITRRGYLLPAGTLAPLLVHLDHTHPPAIEAKTKWMEAADQYSLCIAIPDSSDGWVNYPTHLAALKTQVAQWCATLGADPNRVYLSGFSAGASFALWIANEGSLNVKGVAPVSGWLNKTSSPTMLRTSPCGLLQFMGTTDAVTYQGTSVLYSLREVSQRFVDLNGGGVPTTAASGAITTTTWPCDVTEHLITKGTHQWPGPTATGTVDTQIDATAEISRWILSHG